MVWPSDSDASWKNLWRFSGHVLLREDPRTDPELAEGITYPSWPGKAYTSLRRSVTRKREVWIYPLDLLPPRLDHRHEAKTERMKKIKASYKDLTS